MAINRSLESDSGEAANYLADTYEHAMDSYDTGNALNLELNIRIIADIRD